MADLKVELEVEAKDVTEDEGDFDLQQFLAEIKDIDKEDDFVEQIGKGYMDRASHTMTPCRHNYTDVTCANDEEHVSVSIEKDAYLSPSSYHQDSLDPSACSIKASSLATCNQASELFVCVDGGSNAFLVTTENVLHNVVPRVGAVI